MQSNETVLIDTGNAGAFIPKQLYDSLYASVNPNEKQEIDCKLVSKIPSLTITFEGASKTLTITGTQQVNVRTNCICTLIFSASPRSKLVFGSSFLANYYTTFDFSGPQVTFYEASNQVKHSCF